MNHENDHDMLVEIRADLKNALSSHKELKTKFEAHEELDRNSFKDLNRIVWMGIGVIGFLEIAASLCRLVIR